MLFWAFLDRGKKLKTIAIPSVKQGTGAVLALTTVDKARDWTDEEDIFAGSFDTTSANTGVIEGAMSHIQNLLGRKILWLPCRHHIAELHIKHTYMKIMNMQRAKCPKLNKSNLANII